VAEGGSNALDFVGGNADTGASVTEKDALPAFSAGYRAGDIEGYIRPIGIVALTESSIGFNLKTTPLELIQNALGQGTAVVTAHGYAHGGTAGIRKATEMKAGAAVPSGPWMAPVVFFA
jgi:hypothetical protein